MGKMSEGGQKTQPSSYKINKFWVCNAQQDDYSQQYCIAYLKVAERIDLINYYKKSLQLSEVMDVNLPF